VKHKKVKKIKTKKLGVEKKHRGRPKGSKNKKTLAMTNVQKIAKLGKRKYKKAVENMAVEKLTKEINKKRKKEIKNLKNHVGEIVETRNPRDQGYFDIVASAETHTPAWRNGKAQKMFDKIEKEKIKEYKKKITTVSKVELNRYIKNLKARGLHPENIKVLENEPEYFRIEFNDGKDGAVVVCSHYKAWDKDELKYNEKKDRWEKGAKNEKGVLEKKVLEPNPNKGFYHTER